ncbi:CPBP family intramembrane glutamic endopeptidase [Ornithinicoccus halotolerans]|uniref:CPBP family intramembrane glutamic endopeptidase n=1 Tax=Ornithinicoccus halotolerans TaxID=1748220 RepID=UPI0012974002|nr:CPBP family intramembrane glutamic endopeptidase [Ornithinicoccus halotolerans]
MSASPGQPPGVRMPSRVVLPTTLAAGTLLLAVALRQPVGDETWLLLALLATCVWGVGGLLSGPVPVGRLRRPGEPGPGGPPLLAPLVVGVVAVALTLAGAVLLAHLPVAGDSLEVVVDRRASQPWWLLVPVLVIGGVGEELMFRGALYDALGRWRPVAATTVVYTLATAATGQPMLILAAFVLAVLTGVQRRVSGGVLAPALTHVTWTVGMALLLPPVLGLLG